MWYSRTGGAPPDARALFREVDRDQRGCVDVDRLLDQLKLTRQQKT